MEINNNKNDKKKEIVFSSSRPVCTGCFYDEQIQLVGHGRHHDSVFCPMHKAIYVAKFIHSVTLIFNSAFVVLYYFLYLFNIVKENRGIIAIFSIIGCVFACFSLLIALIVFVKQVSCCSHKFRPKRIQK